MHGKQSLQSIDGRGRAHRWFSTSRHRVISGSMRLTFEPPSGSGDEEGAARALLEWVQRCGGRNITALTGAGISTESGVYPANTTSFHAVCCL